MILYQLSRIILTCFLAISTHFQSHTVDETKYTKLDSILTAYDTYVSHSIKDREIPGVAIAIVIDDQIEYIKGFGVKKVGESDSIGIHSVFRLASVSKGFASVLTGLLVKEGILDWDDKVIKYLPGFSLKDSATTQDLTIRHILSHTSGLVPHAYDKLIEANYPFKEIKKRLKEVNIACAPGEFYGYQNTVYSLISEILHSATNKEYTDLLKQRITQPLGMQDVSFSKDSLLKSKHQAEPHVRRYGQFVATKIRDTYYNVPPAAGVNASIYDMAYWLRALLGGAPDIIPLEIIKEVCKPNIITPRLRWHHRLRKAAYGLGWRIFDYAGYTMIFHSGGLRGYFSQIAFLPKYKMGIVVLQNASMGNNFLYKFIDMYFNIEPEQPHIGAE